MTAKKPTKSQNKYTFIDLFAGIGGFHHAFHNVGAECIFASEWDEHARKTYQTNFETISPKLFSNNNFAGDITKVNKENIPDFDILTGGFPCQPFSQAGYKLGFNDTRGTLFFEIAEILRLKRPKAFFLENVKHLYKHDDGKTFETIKKILTEDLGYTLYHNIVKASEHGLPQNRPRLFMIGFRDKGVKFKFPDKRKLEFTMSDVFGAPVNRDVGFTIRVGGKGSTIDDRRNWDSYLVNGEVKRIGVKEAKKMQGFPDNFVFPVSHTQAMKQLGNSVAIYAVQDYAQGIINSLNDFYA